MVEHIVCSAVKQQRCLLCSAPFQSALTRLSGDFGRDKCRNPDFSLLEPVAHAPLLLADDFQVRVQRRQRIGPNPKIEGGRILDPVTLVAAPVPKLVRAELERHRLRLTRLERDALKSFELTHRSRIAAILLMDIQLRDLITGDRARVGHIDRHQDLLPDLHLLVTDPQVREGEAGIAQTKAKGKER